MPMLDMPLEELRTYRGTNPKPDDFDAYWDAALSEMRATDPQIEIKEASFKAPYAQCFDLYFTGVRGGRVHVKLIKPLSDGKHPALLHFHGYSINVGDWCRFLPYVAAGYVVAAMDCRGQGGQSREGGGFEGTTHIGAMVRGLDGPADTMAFRQIYCDAAQTARIVAAMDDVDEARLGAWGGSQGGALSLVCAALEPRLKRVVSYYPFLADFQRVWEMDLGKDAYRELTYYFRNFDPRHLREKEIFTRLGYIDVHHLASQVKAQVLMHTGLQDQICPPSAQFAVFNALTGKKEMRLYPDYAHEVMPTSEDATFQFLLGV